MKRLSLFALSVFFVLTTVVAAQTSDQPQPELAYEDLNNPVSMLASYYNAIELKDYQRAYGYWRNAPQTYEDFAAGFSDTEGVQLIVEPPTRIDPGAGNLFAQVPTVVVADHTDGTQHTYAGCFVTHKPNLPPQESNEAPIWTISSATMIEVEAPDINIATLLADACTED